MIYCQIFKSTFFNLNQYLNSLILVYQQSDSDELIILHPLKSMTDQNVDIISNKIKEKVNETASGSIMLSNGELTISKCQLIETTKNIESKSSEEYSYKQVSIEVTDNVTSRRKVVRSASKNEIGVDMEVNETIEIPQRESIEIVHNRDQNQEKSSNVCRKSNSRGSRGMMCSKNKVLNRYSKY